MATAKTTVSNGTQDIGKLILRVTLGVLILLHGIMKVTNGPTSVIGLLSKMGLPPALAYLVYVGEVIAPLLVIFGIWTRAAAAVIAINMLVAVLLAHTNQIFTLTKAGGWGVELQGMYFFSALAVALLGAGRYGIGGSSGRWN